MEKIRVLLVEDNKDSILILTCKLKDNGFTDLVVVNGLDALDQVKNEQFSLILTELSFPSGINGFELIKQIRSISNYKDIPIIVVASVVTRESEKKSFEVGATDFIAKPIFDFFEFIRRIKTHIVFL